MSHPQLFMWGESRWLIGHLLSMCGAYNAKKGGTISGSWKNLKKDGPQKGWYPTLTPLVPIEQLSAKWLNELFANPEVPNGSWGCKFVLITPRQVEVLGRIFPDAAFIYLSRPWPQVQASIQKRPSWWPDMKISDHKRHWTAMTQFFKSQRPPGHHVEYDRLVEHPDATTALIERYLGIPMGTLDRTVFTHKIVSHKPKENTYGRSGS